MLSSLSIVKYPSVCSGGVRMYFVLLFIFVPILGLYLLLLSPFKVNDLVTPSYLSINVDSPLSLFSKEISLSDVFVV